MKKGKCFLKPTKKNADTKIWYILHLKKSGKNFKFTTDQTISPKHWDKKSGMPISLRSNSKYYNALEDIREGLNKYGSYTEQLEEQKHTLTAELLKEKFGEKFKGKKTIIVDDVFNVYDHFLDSRRFYPKTGQRVRERTLEKYRGFKSVLQGFNSGLTFNDFTPFFETKFKDYCLKRMASKTYNARLMTLKSFLNYCLDNNYLADDSFKQFRPIHVDKYEADKVVLSMEQVKQLYELRIEDKDLSDTRHLFLLGALTGARLSDYTRINRSHLRENDEVIRINSVKTNKISYVPMIPMLRDILEMYNYNLPPTGKEKMNYRIKLVGKLAGWNELQTFKVDGKEVTKPFYARLTTHVGKRTYVSIMSKKGVPLAVISKITGTSIETLSNEYITITESDIAKIKLVW